MFVSQVEGNDLFARYVWATGDDTRTAANEVTLDDYYSEFYVQITWRANANWQFSSGAWKTFFFQNRPWQADQNTAVGIVGSGAIGTLNTGPGLSGARGHPMGEWYDDEFYFSAIPGPSIVKAWRNNVLEIDETGVGTGSAPTNMLSLGPYHGGTGVKSQNGDFIDIKRLVIWAR